jgi:polysaccharide export outer membrane protein
MSYSSRSITCVCCLLALATLLGSSGCRTVGPGPLLASAQTPAPAPQVMPRELSKVVLPTYTIEPPDILMVDAIHVVPRPPYHLRTLDVLGIRAPGALPQAPIDGAYPIELGGAVNLGPAYGGSVPVAGKTVEDAEKEIQQHLSKYLKDPTVSVTLLDIAAKQQIAGEHLVGPDGTVTLGSYGSVRVVGLTIAQARQAIQDYLSRFLQDPEVSVDVFGYNSKVYYVVTQGAGLGDGLYRFPITGNETVLDAVSQINGLEQVSSKRIWIARPTREPGRVQILPVNWEAITAQASPSTNYQILPGDRLFIAEDKLIAFDTGLAKLTAPLERIMGFSLLGAGTVTRYSGAVLRGGGNRQSTF